MKLVWSPSAQFDLLSIYRFLVVRNPQAAEKMMKVIALSAQQLVHFPQLGRPTDKPNIRLLQVAQRNYLLPYRVSDDTIEILAVFDERMERPKDWQ